MDIRNQYLSDLYEIINSPSLINSSFSQYHFLISDIWCQKQLLRHKKWFHEINQQHEVINDFFSKNAPPPYSIGRYFEMLLKFWFTHSPYFELLLSNKQVIKNNITLGEIDFVFKDLLTGEDHHWEVAVKFYLGWRNRSESKWIGPSAKDSLEKKMNSLKERQLKLPANKHVKSQLKALKVKNLHSSLFMKGQLFYHPLEKANPPSYASLNQAKGIWMFEKQTFDLLEEGYYVVLPKMEWLRKKKVFNTLELLNKQAVISDIHIHFTASNKALMICKMMKKRDYYNEISRIMIVNEKWPNS